MKFIKAAVLSAFLSVPVISAAMGTEEFCDLYAERTVEMKNFFNSDPENFSIYLKVIQESNYDTMRKAHIRELGYWVFNRRTLSDEDIESLSIIKCLNDIE